MSEIIVPVPLGEQLALTNRLSHLRAELFHALIERQKFEADRKADRTCVKGHIRGGLQEAFQVHLPF